MINTVAMISLGSWLLDKIKDKGFDALYSKLNSSNETDIAFNKVVAKVSKKLHTHYPDVLAGRMEYFFKSENVFRELVKLLFINSTVNLDIVSSHFDTDTLPPNFILDFISELKSELLTDEKLAKLIYDKELYILVYGVSNDIENIALNSTLAVAEIKEIKKLLEQRIEEKFIYDDFITLYSNNAVNNLSQVNFIGLGVGVDISKKINRKKLNDVFVKPSFTLSENASFKEQNFFDELDIDEDFQIDYNQLFNFGSKVVVLGNPGAGKSVLVKSIICNILDKKNVFDEDVINYLPFRIELRKYLAYKKQNRGNIVKYLNSLLEEEYGINNMTEILLESILNTKPNIFFFDGLDEIFKVEDKIDIKNDIEIFHNTFSNSKSFTTSRIIGYDEAKLNEEVFCEVHINNFNDVQIEEYLNKWYEKEEDSMERRMSEVNGFLSKKHEIDNELVSNPLLLSLIVIIYRNTLAIPESKLEIYQSCTKTLVEKWDASKTDLEINLDLSIYKKRDIILADLAYWQYQQLSGDQIEITFEKALNRVGFSLERLKISEDFEVYAMAESFMEYAQKRSIYFDNNFTHKTFLEYYAAYWIYSNIEKKNKTQERNLLISKYVENPFWHIVLELLLNMIDKNQADTEIMDELINYQISNDKKSVPFILSTISSYKNVGSDCITEVINYILKILIDEYEGSNFSSVDSIYSKIFETFKIIFNNDSEIKKIIIKQLIVKENELKENDVLYALYFEIALIDLTNSDDDYIFELSNEELFNSRLENNKLFVISTCYNIRSIRNRKNYLQVALEFITKFGLENFYKAVPLYFDASSYFPMIHFYLRTQINEKNIKDFSKNIKTLIANGVEVNKIINYVEDNQFFLDSIDRKCLIDLFDNEDNNTVKLIVSILFFNSRISSRVAKEEFKNIKESSFLLRISLLPKEQRISEICQYYNFIREQ